MFDNAIIVEGNVESVDRAQRLIELILSKASAFLHLYFPLVLSIYLLCANCLAFFCIYNYLSVDRAQRLIELILSKASVTTVNKAFIRFCREIVDNGDEDRFDELAKDA